VDSGELPVKTLDDILLLAWYEYLKNPPTAYTMRDGQPVPTAVVPTAEQFWP
jgi:hypothetical protein